jgi:hypothetical protein
MAASIFISFASKDVKVAQTLCAALESRGLPCLISARDIQPGENFQVSIVQALRHAKIMVLVFTANSNTSEEMTKELALASQQRLIVIPLRVEDVTPSDAFTYEFATRQWIDVFADWESSIDQLCRRITRALEGPAPTEATVPAELVPDLPPEPQAERAAAPIKVAPLAVEPVRAEPVKAEPAKVEPVKAAAAKADPEKSAPEKVAPIETRASAPREKVADAASAQANTATAELEDVEAKPPRSGVNPLILIAAALAVVAGVGVVGPKLFHGKARPAVAVAAAPPAGLIPAANNGQAAAVAAPAIADVALTAPPVQAPKVKRRAAKRQADTDIPY